MGERAGLASLASSIREVPTRGVLALALAFRLPSFRATLRAPLVPPPLLAWVATTLLLPPLVVLLMGELFCDTLRKKDASRHGERAFSVMCHKTARPFTDLRGVPSRTLLKAYIFIEVNPRGGLLSLNRDSLSRCGLDIRPF